MNYPDEFEQLWDAFDTRPKFKFGKKGDKPKAYIAYKKYNPNKVQHQILVTAVQLQILEKERFLRNGRLAENFKHVCRYIKDERWNDELVLVEEKKSFVDKLTDRSWAD